MLGFLSEEPTAGPVNFICNGADGTNSDSVGHMVSAAAIQLCSMEIATDSTYMNVHGWVRIKLYLWY